MQSNDKLSEITMTEEHLLASKIVKDDFRISVAWPRKGLIKDKAYPVIYLLDSDIFWGLFVDTVRLLQYGQEIPEAIVVGIGYPKGKDNLYLRNRDFGPTAYDMPEIAGGAHNFLHFLMDELKPFIESRYPIDASDCTLVGDSMSGLFALYTLFHEPKVFNRYVVGSPSLYWDEAITFSYEQAYFEKNKTLDAQVFMSSGALEAKYEPAFAKMVDNMVDLSKVMRGRGYEGLTLTRHIFENETHLSVIPATFSRGIREVFNSKYKD